MKPSGWSAKDSSPWDSTPRSGRLTRLPPIPATAWPVGSWMSRWWSKPSADYSPTTCSAAGACERFSAAHPAFNPFSYHRGTVWPVEHGSFAIGFMRYGLHAALEKIARGMFEAAAIFDFNRLPEVFSGYQRDERHPFPAMYPKTNWPQAWSSSAALMIVQCLLGIYPYAPLHALFVDPHLPDWLPEITLTNLHVGKAVVAIRFYREKDGSWSFPKCSTSAAPCTCSNNPARGH